MITKEMCDIIVGKSNIFKVKKEIIDDYRVYKYYYNIQNDDIIKYSAEELRGVTFVENGDTYDVFPMLHKFYNLNQIPETNIDIIKTKKIKKISTKMDGSLIGFYKIPNGKIYPMTKGSFNNPIIDQVNEFMSANVNIMKFVKEMFKRKIYPLFEWVSPKNQIVLQYNNDSLTLLQIRNENGDYLDIDEFQDLIGRYEIEVTKYWDVYNIEVLLDLKDNIRNFEGWVIQFDDNSFIKLKTEEYFELHKILSVFNLKIIFKLIVNDDLDDYIDKFTENGNMFTPYGKSKILEIEKSVKIYMLRTIRHLEEIVINSKSLSIKEFAIKYKQHEYFPILIKMKKDLTIETYAILKELLLKRYRNIIDIENFIENIK